MTIVTINRDPDWGDMPVGAAINLPDALADPMIAAGEAVPTPGATPTQDGPFAQGVAGGVITTYTAAQLAAKALAGTLTQYARYVASDTGVEYRAASASALSPTHNVETTPYVTLTATGTAFTGACEYAGYYCTVAAGNITVYDNTSAAGNVIVPTTALATGPFPVFGAGTNGKEFLGTGCHVVLSGAATVRILVG